jgi:hypothetical protein
MSANDKKWFEKIRVNSWEIEILIVACILAFLFNLPDFISERVYALQVSDHYDYRSGRGLRVWELIGDIKGFMLDAVSVCIGIAKITFSLYIFFRGFWVASIGLSSVFPNGINIERLNFSSYFNDILEQYHFDKFILRLDNICSSIFSLGFLSGFFYVSIFFFLSLTCLLLAYLFSFFPIISDDIFRGILLFFLGIGFIFLLDILLLGILKKVKWKRFSYLYSILYNFLRIITLFFIYESLYYLLISNTKKRVALLIALITILSTIVYWRDSLNADGYFDFYRLYQSESIISKSFYEDRMLESEINFSSKLYPFINSEIISESYLKLYVPFQPSMHASIDSACSNINSNYDAESMSDLLSLIDCINSQYMIYIDGDTIENDFIVNKYSGKDINLNTFFMPISVKKYTEGRHTVTIEKLFYEYAYFRSNKDSTWVSSLTDDSHLYITKYGDSIIHIPFYIYR